MAFRDKFTARRTAGMFKKLGDELTIDGVPTFAIFDRPHSTIGFADEFEIPNHSPTLKYNLNEFPNATIGSIVIFQGETWKFKNEPETDERDDAIVELER